MLSRLLIENDKLPSYVGQVFLCLCSSGSLILIALYRQIVEDAIWTIDSSRLFVSSGQIALKIIIVE